VTEKRPNNLVANIYEYYEISLSLLLLYTFKMLLPLQVLS